MSKYLKEMPMKSEVVGTLWCNEIKANETCEILDVPHSYSPSNSNVVNSEEGQTYLDTKIHPILLAGDQSTVYSQGEKCPKAEEQ